MREKMARESDGTRKDDQEAWGTLEELLLACAVNRHGTKSWDSISTEVRNRSSNLQVFSPQNCRRKYYDLRRRFTDGGDESEMDGDRLADMVDELRRLRVAELRREVQRHDVSIVSLQLKVKRLEEERDRSLKEEGKPDLKEDQKDGEDAEKRRSSPETDAGKSVSGEDSDRDGGSFDESNSTNQKCENRGEDAQANLEPAETATIEPDPARTGSKQTRDWSFNACDHNTSGKDTEPASEGKSSGAAGGGRESNSVWESAAAEYKGVGMGREGVKQSSDMQSSASLSKGKRRRRGGVAVVSSSGGEEPEADEISPATKPNAAVKSQPLVRFLDIIRSHKFGSAFERRLRSQETERYKNVIRQHMDLRTVRSRLEKGAYSDSAQRFFRDLLLLFGNGVVFFRRNTPEYLASRELRSLVLREMSNHRIRAPRPSKPDPNHQPTHTSTQKQNPKPSSPPPAAVPVAAAAPVGFRKRSGSAAAPIKATPAGPPSRNRDREEKINSNSSSKGGSATFSAKPKSAAAGASPEEKKGAVMKRMMMIRGRSFSGKRTTTTSSKPVIKKTENGTKEVSRKRGSERSSSSSSSSEEEREEEVDGVKKAEENKAALNKKKQGAAEFLKRMKQRSPPSKNNEVMTTKNKNYNDDNEDDDDNDDSGDDSDDDDNGRERKEAKKTMRKGGGRAAPAVRSSNGKASRAEEVSEKSNNNRRVVRGKKRGVGRPPKRGAAVSPAPPLKRGREMNGNNHSNGRPENGRPTKRSRR
ncbi:uncharacterized protein LOC131149714 [Malania oleifera]|uniref:uncharacterized protein LOC131149714 n=1 Tax=Malania oleifera TaxID=397392 RepID=UPI0025ADCF30|nr:uncharacterized protein LOC131149714 [Malania oleifera]